MNRQRSSLAVLWVHFAWVHVGILDRTNALNESYVAGTNLSETELVMDCNAVQSAASYGLAWLSLLDDLPPKSIVKYAGVGVDEGGSSIPQCSLGTPDLCGWVLLGASKEWTITSSLGNYLGPILDYRWEDIRTDGSEKLQKPIFVSAGTVAISLKAARDAHIQLSFGEDPTSSPTYYIILGGWWNTLSVIRRCPQGIPAQLGDSPLQQCYHRRHQKQEANVLSAWKWKHFIISLTPDGEISVNRTEGPQLLRWKDPQPYITRGNTSFYLNFRTQHVVGNWRVHAASYSLIKPSTVSGELTRLFSPNFKINQSTICVTLLHYMSTRKNIPGMGLMIEKRLYVNMISQQIGKDKGWKLIKYTGKVLKEHFGKIANLVISVNRNQSSPIAIQDIRACPSIGIRRIAQLRVQRNEMRPNESFVCLPVPNSNGMFLQCPPVKIETINGVCVTMTKTSNSSCQCRSFADSCSPPCNITNYDNSVLTSCQPDLKTCSFFPPDQKKQGETTTSSSDWSGINWSTTESILRWTTNSEAETTAIETGKQDSERPTQATQVKPQCSANETIDECAVSTVAITQDTTTTFVDWSSTKHDNNWGSTESTLSSTADSEPEVTERENEKKESEKSIATQNLKVTSRSHYWLKIRWQSPGLKKFNNCSAFHISWWKTKSDEVDEKNEAGKWEQSLKIGTQTLCPFEQDEYFCGTLWNLEPNQNYTISVKPECSANETSNESAVRITAATRQVPWGPSHVYVTNRTETTITLIWEARIPPDNNMSNIFSIFYRELQLQASSHEWKLIRVLPNEGRDKFTHQIGNLSSAVWYEFCIHLDKLDHNLSVINENGESVDINHHPVEFTFRENLTSVCTNTRTLLEKPFIPDGTILYRSCTWSSKFLNIPITLKFNHSEIKDQVKARAYLLCMTNIKSKSRTFNQNIRDELLKELRVKELHIAAELNKNLHDEIYFNIGDGTKTNGTYGVFVNVPLNSSIIGGGSNFDVILIAVGERNGERRYSWQKALYPQECSSQNVIILVASIVGIILFLALGAALIFLWKCHNRKNLMSDCLLKISVFCCKRRDVDSEWKDLSNRENTFMNLTPIEPDDQLEYSSDSEQMSSLSKDTNFS